MTTTEHTAPADRVARVLEGVLRGQSSQRIARETTGFTAELVDATAVAHGHPSARALREAVQMLRALGPKDVTYDVDLSAGRLMRHEPVSEPEPPAAQSPTPTPPAPAPSSHREEPDGLSLEDVLAAARAHDVARIQNLAARAQTWIDKIRTALAAEAEEAERRARIAQIRKELAELTRGGPLNGAGGVARYTPGGYPCPEDGCEWVGDSPQARGGHRRTKHLKGETA